jgi:hypothetical protein
MQKALHVRALALIRTEVALPRAANLLGYISLEIIIL